MPITDETLLAEVEDLLRTQPEHLRAQSPETIAWFGRAGALVEAWNSAFGISFRLSLSQVLNINARAAGQGVREILTLLHQMRSDLLMKVRGPLSTVVGRGMVYDYFDELRKILEPARQDVLFVDPYLDADFVSRYLPNVHRGTRIRLLGREKMATLMPAVRMFVQQNNTSPIEVRSAPNFHDRYVFIDGSACYQSGASFKDGGRAAPTTLTQITDAFAAMQSTYESIWGGAKVEQ